MVTQNWGLDEMIAKRKWLLCVGILILFFPGSASYGAELPSSVKVSIPDYMVTTKDGLDYVDIPGGEVLLAEEGRPRVPYYVKSIDYPEGYRVQDVILKERSGLKTTTGLRLPVVILSPKPKLPIEMKKGWYPEKEYEWRVWDNPDGSTTLVISIYPFYYNPETTEVKFYRNYRFEIEYIVSKVKITALSTDKDAYKPGDRVTVDVRLNNSGETRDVVVNLLIKEYGSNRTTEGLPVRTLKGLIGDASYSTTWNTDNIEPGYYYVEATLTDASGSTLDRKTTDFAIAVSVIEHPRWDINEDAAVGPEDLAVLAAHYGESTAYPYPRYDINQDGEVDYKDLAMLGAHYGERY